MEPALWFVSIAVPKNHPNYGKRLNGERVFAVLASNPEEALNNLMETASLSEFWDKNENPKILHIFKTDWVAVEFSSFAEEYQCTLEEAEKRHETDYAQRAELSHV